MIYLLRSPAWDKEEGYYQLLKIGWSDDTNKWLKNKWKGRKRSYKSHNPTSEVLIEIPGLSKDVEEALHDLFSTHRYKDMNEWYFFVPEILNYFSSPDLLQNLEGLRERGKQLREEREWKIRNQVYNYYLEDFLGEIKGEINFPIITSRMEDWWEQVKQSLPNISFIQLENTIGLYESIRRSRNKEVLDIFHQIVKAKTEEKRKNILNEALEWMDESDFTYLSSHLPRQSTINYYLKHGND